MNWLLVILLVTSGDVQEYKHKYPSEYATKTECEKNRASIIWAWDPKETEYIESWCIHRQQIIDFTPNFA